MIQRLAVRVFRGDDGIWTGQLGIKLADGQLRGGELQVDENAIRQELARQYMPDPGAVSGSIFSKLGRWLKRTAQKIARWKVWKTIGKVVKAIVKSPIIAGIVGVASTIFPPIGATYLAAKGAAAVVEKVQKGVDTAIKGLGTIAKAAPKNPMAAQAVAAVKAADQSPLRQFIPVAG